MSRSVSTVGGAGGAAEPLPEFWPSPPATVPARAWWIPWPLAIVLVPLLWLLPKRMGPHFAAVRWPGVILGHLIWTVYGVANIFIAYDAPHYSWVAYALGRVPGQQGESLWPAPTLSEIARSPMAAAVWPIVQEINSGGKLLLGLSVVIMVEVGLAVLSTLLIPFAAVGEARKYLDARCLKLTLWMTTSLIVLGLVLQVIELRVIVSSRYDRELSASLVVVLYIVWFIWIWLRATARYAGPTEGPAWQPRRPLCEDCGYTLTGLTPADRCPECGCPISMSLPQNRRPSPFAAATGPLARIPAFFKTFRGALFDRLFYRKLATHDHLPAARRFAVSASIVGGLTFTALFLTGTAATLGLAQTEFKLNRPWEGETVFAILWVSASVVLLLIGGAVAFFFSPPGLRSTTGRLPVTLYAATWALPFAAAAAIACVVVLWFDHHRFMRGNVDLGWFGPVDAVLVYGVIPFALPPIVAVLALRDTRRAVRQTRFANA